MQPSSSSTEPNFRARSTHGDDDDAKKRRVGESSNEEDMIGTVTLAPMSKSLLVRNRDITDFTEKRQDGERWDFTIGEHRREAASSILKDQPILIIGGSRCRGSSGDKVRDETSHAAHIEFLLSLYKEQEKNERYFVHEQKNGSGDQIKRSFQKLQSLDTVTITIDAKKYKKIKKDMIKIVTNSPMIASKISQGNVVIRAGTRKKVDRVDVCKQVRKGLNRQLELDDAMDIDAFEDDGEEFFDAITWEKLDSRLVRIARREEIEYYRQMNVYSKVSKAVCVERTGKAPIKVMWVDHNKGTNDKPEIRSRLVAKEIKTSYKPELFAATPPLEALKLLLSINASSQGEKRCIMHNDVSRAYFHAPAVRDVFVEIVDEDREKGDEEKCGWLNVSMYGTRDAASNWESKYQTVLIGMGFQMGKANPCVFLNKEKNIRTVVHGDDFTSDGEITQLRWMQRMLEEKFALKTKIMGAHPDLLKELKILNRTIRWHDEGITYEADDKHASSVIKDLNLEHCKAANTPGDKMTGNGGVHGEDLSDSKLLIQGRATQFRSVAARCNYLASDRPDIQFAVKETSRGMANPTEGDWAKLKRLARYLKAVPKMTQWFARQELPRDVICFTDSDWAGCRRTRKSTSGGGIRLGNHLLKSWSKTQTPLATSSGEAELYAAVKGGAELLGMQSLAADLGVILQARLKVDAKATIGMVHRTGLGKLRHVEVGNLWIQSAVKTGRIRVDKVLGSENIADLMTKHLDKATMDGLMARLPLEANSGSKW
jgi:hypothetical protein